MGRGSNQADVILHGDFSLAPRRRLRFQTNGLCALQGLGVDGIEAIDPDMTPFVFIFDAAADDPDELDLYTEPHQWYATRYGALQSLRPERIGGMPHWLAELEEPQPVIYQLNPYRFGARVGEEIILTRIDSASATEAPCEPDLLLKELLECK